jgi:hypothetical protein
MRVDNGEPLGDPSGHATPALALWLIAMDVDMIWNKPYCPKMNARVEKMQDTTSRWAEVETAADEEELQHKLLEALVDQRERYAVERLHGQTRVQVFPALKQNLRPYADTDFNVGRVYAFLQPHLYSRKVSPGGQIQQFGKLYSVGYPLRHQWVQLKLNADGSEWEVFYNYKLLKTLPADNLSEGHIQNLTVFQRTINST